MQDTQSVRTDADVWAAVDLETQRQEDQLELIASENHTSQEVMAAMGSSLTNKYAEGYPGRRYYGGCEHVDTVENLARARAKELFNSGYANVQAHSGTQANMGAMMAIAEPGDTVLAMSLDHGGHLSHGHPKNFSGIFYDFHAYGVDRETQRIDMDVVRSRAKEVKPKVLLAGASAYSRKIDFAAFADIAKEVGAKLMVDMAHIAGLVAGGQHDSPVPHADIVTMTTHKTLRGPRGGMVVTNDLEILKKLNTAIFPGGQGGPLMHVIAAKAVALREALDPSFKAYAAKVVENAAALAETLMERGLRIVSGGTDNHLMLVDVNSIGVSGAEAEDCLHALDITCNKNLIPYDERPPMEASGIRLGTAAITTRGLDKADMVVLGGLIADALENRNDDQVAARVKGVVAELTRSNPIYGHEGIVRPARGARNAMDSSPSGKAGTPSSLPVTLLTGFLGAGKTTLVNRILSERHGERIAVVVNEYGELGVDGSLVVGSADELVQLANGCVCCTVRGDLQQSLLQLLEARERRFRRKPFDRILIEASGLAAPGPIAQTLAIDADLRAALHLDGILTLAHAVNLPRQLIEHPEAAQQVAYADRLLINHADRATEEQIAAARASAARHNSLAEVLVSSHANLEVGPLLDVGTTRDTHWDFATPEATENAGAGPNESSGSDTTSAADDGHAGHDAHAGHGHDAHVSSIALRSDAELELPKLKMWLQFLTNRRSHDLYRIKGILRCTGVSERVIVQGMYEWLELGPGEGKRPQQSALVLIGRDLDREEIERGWAACHA